MKRLISDTLAFSGGAISFTLICWKKSILTLDYILFRGNIKPVSAKVLSGSSSDHLAIKGVLEL